MDFRHADSPYPFAAYRRSLEMDMDEIDNRFTYHPPTTEQTIAYEDIRDEARALAMRLDQWCPESREKSLAITKLEEVVFWANASIARRS